MTERPETRAVLVVEDDDGVRRAICRALMAVGCHAVMATSCAEARAQAGSFAIGVFDIQLGDGCGVELAAELLRDGKIPRAIFFTGGADGTTLLRALKLGNVISKADGVETLARAVR